MSKEINEKCIWTVIKDGDMYNSSCEGAYVFSNYEVGIDFFPFNFCPYCGAKAVEVVLGAEDE